MAGESNTLGGASVGGSTVKDVRDFRLSNVVDLCGFISFCALCLGVWELPLELLGMERRKRRDSLYGAALLLCFIDNER